MSCDWVEFRLLLHAHQELGWWERWRITRHLRHCPTCREQHERFRLERRAIASCLRISPASRVADRVALQIGVRRPASGPRIVVSRRLPILFLMLVAVSAAGAGMVYVGWAQRGDLWAAWRLPRKGPDCSYERPAPATPAATAAPCLKEMEDCPTGPVAPPSPHPAPAPPPGKTLSP